MLDLLWEVFLLYGFEPEKKLFDDASHFFDELMRRYASEDLDKDYRNGVRLCVATNAYFPEQLPWGQIHFDPSTTDEWKLNVDTALSVIDRQLGVDIILTPSLWVSWEAASFFIPLCLVKIKDALLCRMPRVPRNPMILSPTTPNTASKTAQSFTFTPHDHSTTYPQSTVFTGDRETPLSPIISRSQPFTPYTPLNHPSATLAPLPKYKTLKSVEHSFG